MRGLERRVAAGLSPDVRSVASVFVSRWDKATMEKVPGDLARSSRHRDIAAGLQGVSRPAGLRSLAAAGRTGRAAAAAAVRQHQQQGPAGLRRALHGGARCAEHGQHGAGGDTAGVRQLTARSIGRWRATAATAEQVLAAMSRAGIDVAALARQLQDEGAKGFVNSWKDLLGAIETKSKALVSTVTEGLIMADEQPIETAAWRALAAHHQTIKDVHLRQLFGDDAGRGERLTAEGAGLYLDYSKNRITDETIRLLLQLAHERGVTRTARCDVPRGHDQRHGAACGAARGAAGAEGCKHHGRWPRRRTRRARRAGPDGRLRRARSLRGVARAYRQAHPQRDQYRHRRFVSRARDGVSRAASVQRPVDDLPLRVQRGRRRFHRGHAGVWTPTRPCS